MRFGRLSSPFKTQLFRIDRLAHHCLNIRNWHGFGIHSPSLFNIITNVIEDTNHFYAWSNIELVASKLGLDNHNRYMNQTLFRLINALSFQHKGRLNILELGIYDGLSTSYLASPCCDNSVFSVASSSINDVQCKVFWNDLNLHNIKLIDNCKPDVVDNIFVYNTKMDFIFFNLPYLKENYEYYLNACKTLVHKNTIALVNSPYYDEQSYKVWKLLKSDQLVTTTMDYYKFAVVFFNPSYIRNHYYSYII